MSWLLSDIKKLQDVCYANKKRYCSLDSLALPDKGWWGQVGARTATFLKFDEYDVLLIVAESQYCVAAFPVRIPSRFDSLWRDQSGSGYATKYPWREVPPACSFLDIPKLLAEIEVDSR